MKKLLIILPVIAFLAIQTNCTRSVLRQTTREIDRPLDYPREMWQLYTGGALTRYLKGYDTEYITESLFTIDNKTSWRPLITPVWPVFHLHPKVDLFLPALFIYYPLNTISSVDSIEKIEGSHVALLNGVSGAVYSKADGLIINIANQIALKYPLSEQFWFEALLGLSSYIPLNNKIKYRFDTYVSLPLELGYQITNAYSMTSGIILNESYEFRSTELNNNDYDKGWIHETHTFDLDITIPFQMKYVFNYSWELNLSLHTEIQDQSTVILRSSLHSIYSW